MSDPERRPVFIDDAGMSSLDYAETLLHTEHHKWNGIGEQDPIIKDHCAKLRRAFETLNKIRAQRNSR